MKKLADDPLALDKFRLLAASNGYESALKYARDNGFAVEAHIVPTPLADRYETLSKTSPEQAKAFRRLNLDRLNAEMAVKAMATELEAAQKAPAGSPKDPLLGLSKEEKVDAIRAGKSGLHPYDALMKLQELGATEEAWAFEQNNLQPIRDERTRRAHVAQEKAEKAAVERTQRLQPLLQQLKADAARDHDQKLSELNKQFSNKFGVIDTDSDVYWQRAHALRDEMNTHVKNMSESLYCVINEQLRDEGLL